MIELDAARVKTPSISMSVSHPFPFDAPGLTPFPYISLPHVEILLYHITTPPSDLVVSCPGI